MQLLTRDEVAQMLRVAPKMLNQRAYRRRLGLPVVRIGGAIRFHRADVERCIQAGRESLDEGELASVKREGTAATA